MQVVKFKVHFQMSFMKLHLNFGDEKNVWYFEMVCKYSFSYISYIMQWDLYIIDAKKLFIYFYVSS